MLGMFFIAMAIVLIVILAYILMKDSELFQEAEEIRQKGSQGWKDAWHGGQVELVNGPSLKIRRESDAEYQVMAMDKPVFTIGSGPNNDLVVDSKTVEKRHAVIYKRFRNNRFCYELVNYAKVNPTVYYNKKKGRYEYLSLKDGVELEMRDVFYVGSMKMVVSLSELLPVPTNTERMAMRGIREEAEYPKAEGQDWEERRASVRLLRKEEIDF